MQEFAPLFNDLATAIQRRRSAERDLAERFPGGIDEHERELHRRLRDLIDERESQVEQLEEAFAVQRAEVENLFGANLQAVEIAHREALREIERRHNEEAETLEQRFHDSTWVTSSVFDDESDESPKRKFEKYKTLLLKAREDQVSQWTGLQSTFQLLSEQYGYRAGPSLQLDHPPTDRDDAAARFLEVVEAARNQQALLESQWLPKLFTGFRSLGVFVVLTGLIWAPVYFLAPPSILPLSTSGAESMWPGIAGGAAAVLALIIELLVYTAASMRQTESLRAIQQSVADAGAIHQQWLALSRDELQQKTREFEDRQREIVRQRDQAMHRYQAAHQQQRDDIETRRAEAIREETARYHEQRRNLETRQQAELIRIDAEARGRLATAAHDFESEHSQLQQELGRYTEVRGRSQAQSWHALKTDWAESFERFRQAAEALRHAADEAFPRWGQLLDGRWSPAKEIPRSICFGRYAVDLHELRGAVPADARIAPAATHFQLPAWLPFPDRASLLLKFKGAAGRAAAVQVQQTLLLRLLTLLPPGTMRITFLDPVGLGESFAGFMHLADFDEKLVTSRIWTESSQIEAQLADLTEHMENVFQKYLRNEFATIEEYNRHAGEVAEPYRFLVISDFPVKFSEIAARRLASIITSGPRCGVYSLLGADLAQPLPVNFSLSDLHEQMQVLTWRGDAFHPADVPQREPLRSDGDGIEWPELDGDSPTDALEPSDSGFDDSCLLDWPLLIDAPPPPDLFTSIVKMVGRESKDARRVEVSFARIAPRADQWWSQDSRREIDVPLGRAGATKLQHVMLGKGTSQHMLVAGKTGSGKSTFLHALITNVALHYSPQEVRFYLIDFKKGVEFKHYATCGLPHADVIAIESDREFGVSALQRLDAVLQERGELFRRQGVQDIAGFRQAHPETPLPRILLVIDEFQEFFIEDDKLSQTASLLLDRLVRQGRAFGIHVVLGSQTLGGAYSLARTTLGQVAVRVALQCSEADAHLILSESNTAARLLSRPGEAIYNDANGLLEGNHPFQIAWLSDAERESLLQKLARLARERGMDVRPPVVFEGNVPSDPSRNAELVALLRHDAAAHATPRQPIIWLGESVEIGPPTAVVFERHAGCHLLLVGSDSEAARGVMATGLSALAAAERINGDVELPASEAAPAAAPHLFLFDGSSSGSEDARQWSKTIEHAAKQVQHVSPRDADAAVRQLAAELARRESERDAPHPPLFVFVYDLARFRDLRKAEDDYGFGGFGSQAEKPAAPGQQFAELVASGPEVGMHVVAWCDSAGNVERWLSRNTLKEFEQRVAFQMNAGDSSNFIDSPAASRLGVNRALLYREQSGTLEKFRPYGIPSAEWLDQLRGGSDAPGDSEVPAGAEADAGAPQPPKSPEEPELATDVDSFFVT